jgi:hypothetical protein
LAMMNNLSQAGKAPHPSTGGTRNIRVRRARLLEH